MLIETTELSLANMGLGHLHEVALLGLFATTQAHRLVQGTNRTLSQIVDEKNNVLYPGFYRTHLVVPPPQQLESYKVWDRVDIGADVRRYGRMILDSIMVIGKTGEIDADPTRWDLTKQLHLRGALTYVRDEHAGEPQVSAPTEASAAPLPLLRERPTHMDELRRIRSGGLMREDLKGTLRLKEPFLYRVLPGRDANVGRNMMFSNFTALLEALEHTLLSTQHPPMPLELCDYRRLLEREIFYLGNAQARTLIRGQIEARLVPATSDQSRAYEGLMAIAQLESVASFYDEQLGTQLCAAYTKKLLTAPIARPTLIQDANRALQLYGAR